MSAKSDDKVSDCTPSPTGLGNPASMLPYLTAQANSVLSMASGSPGSFFTPPVDLLTAGDHDLKPSASGLPTGLDLGNGWKVVGLTSLADHLPLPTSTQLPPSIAVSSGSGSEPGPQASNSLSEAASLSKSGCILNTPPLLSPSVAGEWKVVGLTSLNSGNCDVLGNSKTTALPVENSALPGCLPVREGAADSSEKDGRAKQNDQSELSSLVNNPVSSSLHLPSLADVAAGTSEWKIAGVTTLIPPVNTTFDFHKPHTAPTDMVTPISPPVTTPDISLADAAKWKVVGVTSLNSPSTNSAPLVASSSMPSPLNLSVASPVVPIPISPSTDKEMVWKVVGMVPLQPLAETLPKDPDTVPADEHENCNISEIHDQIQSNRQEIHCESQSPVSSKRLEKDCVRKSGMSTRVTENRKWVSRCLDPREDQSHPLGFLKNCSNQFRNAVLKRNTVSTMLELKRAYQDMNKKDKLLNFMEEMNHFSLSKNLMYLALKRLSKSRSKSVDCDDFLDQNSDGLDIPCLQRNVRKSQKNIDLREREQDFDSDDEMLSASCSRSSRQLFSNQSATSSMTDDKMALLMAYEVQMESEKTDMLNRKDITFLSAPAHPQFDHEESREYRMPTQRHPEFPEITTDETDDRHLAMNPGDCDNDAVNLTNISPLGVCAYNDFGDMVEMNTEKEKTRIHHSSSRKRKLTTPRKMIQ